MDEVEMILCSLCVLLFAFIFILPSKTGGKK